VKSRQLAWVVPVGEFAGTRTSERPRQWIPEDRGDSVRAEECGIYGCCWDVLFLLVQREWGPRGHPCNMDDVLMKHARITVETSTILLLQYRWCITETCPDYCCNMYNIVVTTSVTQYLRRVPEALANMLPKQLQHRLSSNISLQYNRHLAPTTYTRNI
jgi:hypothetical protein